MIKFLLYLFLPVMLVKGAYLRDDQINGNWKFIARAASGSSNTNCNTLWNITRKEDCIHGDFRVPLFEIQKPYAGSLKFPIIVVNSAEEIEAAADNQYECPGIRANFKMLMKQIEPGYILTIVSTGLGHTSENLFFAILGRREPTLAKVQELIKSVNPLGEVVTRRPLSWKITCPPIDSAKPEKVIHF